MNRRTYLIGLTGLAGTGALGSGAFTTAEADRAVAVDVAAEEQAHLKLAPATGDNGAYAVQRSANQLGIDLNADNSPTGGGSGVGLDSVYDMDDVFTVTNQGTQTVYVWVEFDYNGTFDADSLWLYPGSDRTTKLRDSDDSVVGLTPGETVHVGLHFDTRGLTSTTTESLTATVYADVDRPGSAGAIGSGGDPFVAQDLRTGVADWRVVDYPGASESDVPIPAQVISNPPSAWDTSSDAEWVDPFGSGGLSSDPADDDQPYVYELTFEAATPRDLVIDEYGSDNPVEFFLDGTSVGGTQAERAFDPLRSDISVQSDLEGTHTLRAEVTNVEVEGNGGNPTGLLVDARLV